MNLLFVEFQSYTLVAKSRSVHCTMSADFDFLIRYIPLLKYQYLSSMLFLIQPLIKFKNSFYFEEKDEVEQAEKGLAPVSGSKVSCHISTFELSL